MINTIITRDGEAVPVRLLPIASKSTVTAERWARILAQTDPGMSLTAYHFVDGIIMAFPPKYWQDRVSVDQWPPGAFVWRDELEAAYSRVFYTDALRDDAPDGPEYIHIIDLGEDRHGERRFVLDLDNDLMLDAPLTIEERHRVFEGFEPLQAYVDTAASASMPTERVIWETHFNDSSAIRWDVIAIPKGRAIPRAKAILWMHGLSPKRHPLLTDSLDDEDVPKIIPRRVRDVMGVEDFFLRVRDALEVAAAEKMEEATAAEWVAWADDREMPVHSKFRAIAGHQGAEVGTPSARAQPDAPKDEGPSRPAGPRVVPERRKPTGGDALTRLIWEICYELCDSGERPTPMLVMNELKIRAQSPDPKLKGPLMGAVAGGVKYEDIYRGDQRELTAHQLASRINEWKKVQP